MKYVLNKTVYCRDGQIESEATEMIPAPPDWDAFHAAMLGSTLANVALAQAQQVDSVSIAASTVTAEIVNVSRGADVTLLREAWLHLLSKNLIPADLLQAILYAAQEANLPEHVIAALQPPTT